MVIGALVALGWVSLQRIGVDLFPRVEKAYLIGEAAPAFAETLKGKAPAVQSGRANGTALDGVMVTAFSAEMIVETAIVTANW